MQGDPRTEPDAAEPTAAGVAWEARLRNELVAAARRMALCEPGSEPAPGGARAP